MSCSLPEPVDAVKEKFATATVLLLPVLLLPMLLLGKTAPSATTA
ncbi:hypothetical protein [Serratia microhaemolytica]|nr:hypothetical protein [Serratia microhaemolytica]